MAAYGFVTVVAGLASLISFGLGLVVGGVMAIEVAINYFRERDLRFGAITTAVAVILLVTMTLAFI